MPLPPRDFNTIGPKEGQRFPDVRLPNQSGGLVDLHEPLSTSAPLKSWCSGFARPRSGGTSIVKLISA